MKRVGLALAVLLVLALCLWRITHSSLSEDISFFLPDQDQLITQQLHAMTDSPLVHLVFVELVVEDEKQQELLSQGISVFHANVDRNLFPSIFPPPIIPSAKDLRELVPFLLKSSDWLALHTSYEHMFKRLSWFQEHMLGLGSTFYKQLLQDDPLGLTDIVASSLHASGLLPARSEQSLLWGRPVIMSDDGQSVLLILFSKANPNNSQDAKTVMHALSTIEASLPAGITMHAISSYQYAAANIQSIEADMKVALPVSFTALAILCLLFLRSRRGLLVLLFPPLLFIVAWAILDTGGVSLSGISIGFGAVLLGIVIDYAIHSFYAWRSGLRGMQITKKMLLPLTFIFSTSLCAFLPLLFSTIPGLRQMGLLTLVTLALGVFSALFVLPQLWQGTKNRIKMSERITKHFTVKKIPIIVLLLGVCLLAYLAKDTQVDGDLRSLGVRDQTIINLEQGFSQKWGSGLRGSAFLQITANSENQLLDLAEKAGYWLRANLSPNSNVVNPLYIYPSYEQRRLSIEQWQALDIASVKSNLNKAAQQLGYNLAIFDAFNQWLDGTMQAEYEWPEKNPLTRDIKNILLSSTSDGQHKIYIMFPDDSHARTAMDNNPFAEVVVVSPSSFAQQIAVDIKREFARLGLMALGGVIVCVLFLYRNISLTLLTMAPMLAGTVAILLYAVISAQSLNLFAVAALPLLFGLSIDYGIFMVHGCRTSSQHSSKPAVLLSSLTTLAGFGSLLLTSHPALHSLGITVSIGILGAMPVAMLIPWLMNSDKNEVQSA